MSSDPSINTATITSPIYPGIYGGGNQKLIEQLRQLDPRWFSIIVGSKRLTLDEIKPSDIFTLKFKLLGGKGGFGSLLRSFRIHKSANQLMCRDLTGRRLADVKEEERLRKWIGKKEDRDKAQKRKDEEKLEKLRSGHKVKYHFKDKKYMRQRDIVLESVEDAIEAGVAAVDEEGSASKSPDSSGGSSSKSTSPVEAAAAEEEESDSDIDMEGGQLLLGGSKNSRKRKIIDMPVIEEKKIRIDKMIIKNKKDQRPVAVKITVEEVKQLKPAKSGDSKKAAAKEADAKEPAEIKNYDSIDVEAASDAKELEAYGLEHLKHELECRGLKCGGSLSERAGRLFSIKGLTPDQYPKKIRAASAKK